MCKVFTFTQIFFLRIPSLSIFEFSHLEKVQPQDSMVIFCKFLYAICIHAYEYHFSRPLHHPNEIKSKDMNRIIKLIAMIITALAAISFIIYLQVYGTWTTAVIHLFLIVLFFFAGAESYRDLMIWTACVYIITYLLAFTGLRIRNLSGGRIQLVSFLYPMCPKVYIEGTAIDTIEIATGYGTFAGWYYNISKCRLYAIRDTSQLTTIIFKSGEIILRGHQLEIGEYNGPHGTINIFSYLDDEGNVVKQDLYGDNPDDESYSVNIMDNADYIPDYIP